MMQAKLPRELRDMVYNYLTGPNTESPSYIAEEMAQGRTRYITTERTNLCLEVDPATYGQFHFFCPEYVGTTTALEIVQCLYETMIDEQVLAVSTEDLHAFLSEDPFCVGFSPAKHVQELNIYCEVARYRTLRSGHDQPWMPPCGSKLYNFLPVDQVRLKADLGNLALLVEDKKNLTLQILLVQNNVRISILEEILETLREVRNTFLGAGADVQITWEFNDFDPEFGNHMPYRCNFQVSVNGFFDMPREEWQKNFVDHVMRPVMLISSIYGRGQRLSSATKTRGKIDYFHLNLSTMKML